jgi:hypothetical protein
MAQKAADLGMSSFSDVTRGVQNAAAGMTAVAQANTGVAMRYQAIWREVFQLAYQATQARTESVIRGPGEGLGLRIPGLVSNG